MEEEEEEMEETPAVAPAPQTHSHTHNYSTYKRTYAPSYYAVKKEEPKHEHKETAHHHHSYGPSQKTEIHIIKEDHDDDEGCPLMAHKNDHHDDHHDHHKHKKAPTRHGDPMREIKDKLHGLEHRVKDLESSDIIYDYFNVNDQAVTINAVHDSA